eukprot:gene26911-biopygen17493
MIGGSGGVVKPHTASPHNHCHRASHLHISSGCWYRPPLRWS